MEKIIKPKLVIQANKGWAIPHLRELWQYRSLIWILITRDIKTRYKQQALGPLWLLISPFVSMIILSLVFGNLAGLPSDDLPYPLFLFSGTLAWSFFTSVYRGSLGSLQQFIGWMSKIYVPKLAAPIITITTSLVDWAVQIIILFSLLMFYKVPISFGILVLPLYLLIAALLGAAIGLFSSALSIRYRDLPNLLNYGLNAWYYVTPVLYSSTLVPEKWVWLYRLNPMYWVLDGFRWCLLGKGYGPEFFLILPLSFSILVFLFSLLVFSKSSRNIVDIQ